MHSYIHNVAGLKEFLCLRNTADGKLNFCLQAEDNNNHLSTVLPLEPQNVPHNHSICLFALPVTNRPALARENHQSAECINQAVLTVVAVSPCVRCHRAVTGEVLPLLDAHTHVGARVLLAGCAWAWEKAGTGKEMPQEKSVVKQHQEVLLGLNNAVVMQKKCTLERQWQHVGLEERARSKQCHHRRPDLGHNTQSGGSFLMLGKAVIEVANWSVLFEEIDVVRFYSAF